MTPTQTKRVIRSFTYRQQLSQTVPFLQAQLIQLVQERGPITIGGYRLEKQQGELVVKKLPAIPINQLPLALELLDKAEASPVEITKYCLHEGVCLVCECRLEDPASHCDCPCHAVIH
jgi:ferredoxin